MDWPALWLSLHLAGWTVVLLLPVAVFLGRFMAFHRFAGKGVVEDHPVTFQRNVTATRHRAERQAEIVECQPAAQQALNFLDT